MSEPNPSSTLALAEIKVTPEQMAMIQKDEQAFLSIFKQILAEQAKTNELLAGFLQALAEDQGVDPDAPTRVYLSGAPVHGGR